MVANDNGSFNYGTYHVWSGLADGALVDGKHYLTAAGLTGANMNIYSKQSKNDINGEVPGFQLVTGSKAAAVYWAGGDSTWDATSVAWSNTDATSGSSVAFGTGTSGGKVAVFDSGTAADVVVSGTHYADGVWVKSGAVTLSSESVSGGTLQLVYASKLVIETGASLYLTAALESPETIVKAGGGELLLGAGTFDDRLRVTEGVFGVFSDGSSSSALKLTSGIDMVSGSTLKVVLGGVGTETKLDLNGVASELDGVALEVEGSGILVVTGVDGSNYADVNAWATAVGLTPGVGTWNDGTYVATIAAIPEPTTYALLGGIGAVALALLRRRQRRA